MISGECVLAAFVASETPVSNFYLLAEYMGILPQSVRDGFAGDIHRHRSAAYMKPIYRKVNGQLRAGLMAVLMLSNIVRPLSIRACSTDPNTEPDDTTTDDTSTDDTWPTDDSTDDSSTDDWTDGESTDDSTDDGTSDETTDESTDNSSTDDSSTDDSSTDNTTTDDSTTTDDGTTTDDSSSSDTTTDSATTTDDTTTDSTTTDSTTTDDTTTDSTTTDDTTTESQCCGDTCDVDGGGENRFSIHDGNAHRQVTELRVAATRGNLGLSWDRFHNTVTRGAANPFGVSGSWRHSWLYELKEEKTPDGTGIQYGFIYPDGTRRVLSPASAGKWKADAGLPETADTIPGGIRVHLRYGYAYFTATRVATGITMYLARSIRDSKGFVTKLTYDKNGQVTSVTAPGGKKLTVQYRNISYQRGKFDLQLAVVGTSSQQGQWLEFVVPAAYRDTVFQYLRLRSAKPQLAVAEIQIMAGGSATPLQGRAFGTDAAPGNAFDGVPGTIFKGSHQADFVAVDLGSNASKIDRIRILPAAGYEGSLSGAVFEGMVLENGVRPVISKVATSDGRSITYDYQVIAYPDFPGRQSVALMSANYGDGSGAQYHYDFTTSASRPLLTDADDPRYVGRAKAIRYTYQGEPGTIHEEINPTTGASYASLEFDPTDPLKRTIRYSDLKQETARLDAQGRLVERADSLGRVTRWEYNQSGVGPAAFRIEKNGKRTAWTKDERGHVVATSLNGKVIHGIGIDPTTGAHVETDRVGRQTATVALRIGNNRVKRIVHSDNTVEEHVFDVHGRMIELHLRDGRMFKYTYDGKGQRSSFTDSVGNIWRYEYDSYGRRSAVTDPIGRTTRFERNLRDQVTKITRPDGATRIYAYDTYGNRTSMVDELGRNYQFTYDSLGRMTKLVDPRGRTTQFDYTDIPHGCSTCSLVPQPTRVQSPDGSIATMLYDSAGRLIARTVGVGTDAQATSTFTYDNDDNLVTATDPLGRTRRFTYDDEHHRLTATDPMGRVTQWSYNEQGRLIIATGPSGAQSTFEYDSLGRKIAITNAFGHTTRVAYGPNGRIASKTDADGNILTCDYDADRRRTAIHHPDGTTSSWTYDGVGRVAMRTTRNGVTISYQRDLHNRVVSISDSLGRHQAYTYDTLGRMLSATNSLGSARRFAYNANGRISTVVQADGSSIAYEYDALDRRVSVSDGLGHATKFIYGDAGTLSSIIDANGNAYALSYDGRQRRTAMSYPDSSKEQWMYDAGGYLTTYVNRAGEIKTYSYNDAGQRRSEVWAGSSAGTGVSPILAPAVSYSYNDAGQLITLDNGVAKLTYTYNIGGRVAAETTDLSATVPGLPPQTVTYSYDNLGRLVDVQYPDRSEITYGYNEAGNLSTVDDHGQNAGTGQVLARFSYGSTGKISQVLRSNNVNTAYAYDLAGNLTEILHTLGQAVIAKSDYTLDSRNRRTARTNETGATEQYAYDAASEITRINYANGATEILSYDSAGNRATLRTFVGGTEQPSVGYAANSTNEYATVKGATYGYDANGNLASDGELHYTYDSENRLVSIERSVAALNRPAVRVEFYYDARNRCVARKYYNRDSHGGWLLDNGASVALVYDMSWNLLLERTLEGKVVARYVHGQRRDEVLSADISSPSVQHVMPLTDGLGSTVALVDQRGSVIERYQYSAFGQPIAYTADTRAQRPNPSYRFLFTGREWLNAVGVSEHRHRYYSPTLGRWLTADPLRFLAQDANFYRYVGNAPTIGRDSQGMDNECTAAYDAIVTGLPAMPDSGRMANAAALFEGQNDNVIIMMSLAGYESSYNPNAQNSGSSATGMYQILNGTKKDIDTRVWTKCMQGPDYSLSDYSDNPDWRLDPSMATSGDYAALVDRVASTGSIAGGLNSLGDGSSDYAQKIFDVRDMLQYYADDNEGDLRSVLEDNCEEVKQQIANIRHGGKFDPNQ
jgi:RHS repeat-associated protein